MQLVTSEQMREIDQYTIQMLGIPSMALMENAGRAIAEEVLAYCRGRSLRSISRYPSAERCTMRWGGKKQEPAMGAKEDMQTPNEAIRSDYSGKERYTQERWLILVGKGNNGGDGLVCARHLADAGLDVHLLYAEPPESLRGDAAAQHVIAERLGLPRSVYTPGEAVTFSGFTGIVDALLGTGAKGAPRGAYASLIREANGSGLPIIAADIPSGLDADTGGLHDPCIRARKTVSLAFMKAGLTQYPGAEAAGEVAVRYIGIPAALPPHVPGAGQLLTEASLHSELGVEPDRSRRADGHTGCLFCTTRCVEETGPCTSSFGLIWRRTREMVCKSCVIPFAIYALPRHASLPILPTHQVIRNAAGLGINLLLSLIHI
nr:NAD(P)H-hydrate epimerase [Paenibacillus ihumii]